MSTPRRTVSIVGGGIAGLTLASLLDPLRFDVTLIEADLGRRRYGAGIGLWPSARAVLERLGVWGDLAGTQSDADDAGSLHDIQGRALVSLNAVDIRLLERPRLLAALAGAVPDAVTQRTEQVDDPAEIDADLVIGADGVRSRVRGLVHAAAAERIQTPYVALRGIADDVDESLVGEYWGPGRLFGLAPLGDGRGYWFTTHRSELGPEPLDVAAVLAEAREQFADAAPVVRDLLAAPGTGVGATRMWVAPPMPRYARGRYVVIGDAAHASLPNLGRGACDAILDAASLADALHRGRSLATWQARRLPFTQATRAGASAMMRLALLSRGQQTRDRVFATLGRVV